MNPYLGTRIILAEKSTNQEFENMVNGEKAITIEPDKLTEGYAVVYPDGYRNWYPTKSFEFLYRAFSVGEMKFFEAGKKAAEEAEKAVDPSAENLKVEKGE